MREASAFINREVLQFIANASLSLEQNASEAAFNSLALQLFHFQYEHNRAFQKYAQLKRKTPYTVKNWRDIPPVPIQAFKNAVLSCEPSDEAEAVFMTSGTTNAEHKGRQFHPTLDVWDASMTSAFKHFVMPDLEKMTQYVLSPARDRNVNSSLSRYLSLAVERYGSPDSQFFFNEHGLQMEALVSTLKKSEALGKPVLLLGATFAYVHFLDYCEAHNLIFQLPPGSRILDTGGFKGQSREIEVETLYRQFYTYFHVQRAFCINMYGMTELSSQFYDQTIYENLSNSGQINYMKAGPAWLRTCVLDPNTLQPVENGKSGVLAHYDLANWNSCTAILTEDLGVRHEHGFQLMGRIQGSEARGCSIAVDEFLNIQVNI
ncbi:CoF synthetase [Paenibacillus sp. GP183]|uniref:LuxE/PaaK family acyltransferase n=1 Tax=Paenibacillus sp. GP183 TaxID=1882751 RepID=UPI0008976092|nr:CoF synthetase [Paenibacillus sp. GP183]SEC42754.1 Acyl-protein synthetase, LuxE [Paenibacillus sp. GP183]